MKKSLTLLAAATLSALSFASWADTLTVGASNVPHAEIRTGETDPREAGDRAGD